MLSGSKWCVEISDHSPYCLKYGIQITFPTSLSRLSKLYFLIPFHFLKIVLRTHCYDQIEDLSCVFTVSSFPVLKGFLTTSSSSSPIFLPGRKILIPEGSVHLLDHRQNWLFPLKSILLTWYYSHRTDVCFSTYSIHHSFWIH